MAALIEVCLLEKVEEASIFMASKRTTDVYQTHFFLVNIANCFGSGDDDLLVSLKTGEVQNEARKVLNIQKCPTSIRRCPTDHKLNLRQRG